MNHDTEHPMQPRTPADIATDSRTDDLDDLTSADVASILASDDPPTVLAQVLATSPLAVRRVRRGELPAGLEAMHRPRPPRFFET